MHKSPLISLSRKVSLEGMVMRSRSLAGLDTPPHQDYVADLMSHSSLANLNQYGPGKATISPSSSPTFDFPTSTNSTNNKSRGLSSSMKKRDRSNSGLTFKGHPRQFVKHNYHDHANDDPGTSSVEQVSEMINVRGGVKTPFPLRLHTMLDAVESEGLANIVSWQPHGRAFVVHDTQRFVHEIMPRFFQQHKYSSFQRQLNLYGFMRLTKKGADHGGYYHELFLRTKVFLCAFIQRIRVKGTLIRTTSSPETEPDFYMMPSVEAASMSATTATADMTTTMTMTPPSPPPPPPETVLPPMFPSVTEATVDDVTLIQTRRRFDNVLASVASQQQQQQKQPINMSMTDLNFILDETPTRFEVSTSEESDLEYFLNDVDFYASDLELLAEI